MALAMYEVERSIMVHNISRREFLKLSFAASGGLGLSLAGCKIASEDDPLLVVVDEWISALNAGEVDRFTQLHTENACATIHNRRETVSGREYLYEAYRSSTQNEIDKIIVFRQEKLTCLIVDATKLERSLCYVFNFAGELIDQVYEYDSGAFNLASSPDFPGIELVKGDEGLNDRLEIMEEIFVEGLNNREFSAEFATDSILFYVPNQPIPNTGKDSFVRDGEAYAQYFRAVMHEKIHAFGQGNLACLHVKTEGAGKRSLCFVAEFDDGKIAELYEFWSDASL